MQEFDAIIIGTGQAGPALAHRLTGAGMRVAIVERHRFGGTCVNTGCTPTKTLVASAYAAHLARRAGEFGVMIDGSVTVDMKKVKERKDYVLGFSTRGVERSLRSNDKCTVYAGHARFRSPSEVVVGGEVLTAPRIFINVGGRAFIPDIPGLDQVGYFTNSSMLDVDFVPPHLIVVGGSYIGLEFAQIYRRFGAKVTIIEMAPRLIPREDEDTSAAIADILKAEGIDVHLDVRGLKVAKRGTEIAVNLDSGSGASEVVGSHILMAVGSPAEHG
jgi:pyruvate/2-oxoglutarate dehydrogenase complex dihydrolipoamide dehydrogenase (E3) component